MTGSIAAYRAAELVRLMKTKGWEVQVIMTRAATKFVGELTFCTLSQNPVAVDMFERPEDWKPEHIALAETCDAFVIAPCTANVIAKMALGLADDLLSCTALACPGPVVVAPAMNVHMWNHPATQANVRTLEGRGVTLVDVREGDLACGYQGKGRMAEPVEILTVIESVLARKSR